MKARVRVRDYGTLELTVDGAVLNEDMLEWLALRFGKTIELKLQELGWYDQEEILQAQLREVRRAMSVVMDETSASPASVLAGDLPEAYSRLQEREQELVEEIRQGRQ